MEKEIKPGLPDLWFQTLLKTNSSLPQGRPAIEYQIAPHFFRSVLNGEVTPIQVSHFLSS